nr:MAG TPA: hypothetical protein [Bacteriophage sp.]
MIWNFNTAEKSRALETSRCFRSPRVTIIFC